MTQNILLLAGDGIGPEIMAQAVRVLEKLKADGLDISWDNALIGGCAVDATGVPFPPETLAKCHASDAVLLGAVGGEQADNAPIANDVIQHPQRVIQPVAVQNSHHVERFIVGCSLAQVLEQFCPPIMARACRADCVKRGDKVHGVDPLCGKVQPGADWEAPAGRYSAAMPRSRIRRWTMP